MRVKKSGLIKTLLGLLVIPVLLFACTLPANPTNCSVDSGGYGDTAGYGDMGGYDGGYGDSGAYDDDFG